MRTKLFAGLFALVAAGIAAVLFGLAVAQASSSTVTFEDANGTDTGSSWDEADLVVQKRRGGAPARVDVDGDGDLEAVVSGRRFGWLRITSADGGHFSPKSVDVDSIGGGPACQPGGLVRRVTFTSNLGGGLVVTSVGTVDLTADSGFANIVQLSVSTNFFCTAHIDNINLSSSKADILIGSGVPGKGLANAPGLQEEFNPKSKAAENAGKK